MHHLQRKHCTMNSGMDAPSQTATMHHDQRSMRTICRGVFKEWNKVNREKLSLYYENKDPTVPLVDNKEFRSIKNMIIRAVMEMPPEVEIAQSAVSEKDNDDDDNTVGGGGNEGVEFEDWN